MSPPEGPLRFKSHFSLLSLLPARHPPLVVSDPIPIPTHSLNHITQPLPDQISVSRYPTIVSDPSISPVQSQYALPSTPSTSSSPILPPWNDNLFRPPPKSSPEQIEILKPSPKVSKSPPRRPPPIDLERIKRAYPSPPAANTVTPAAATARLSVPPAPAFSLGSPSTSTKTRTSKSKAPVKPSNKIIDDPFDFAEVESGHRYPSWQGGKVNLRPGQVLPRGVLDSWGQTSKFGRSDPKGSTEKLQTPVEYDSVLHNVLLTPTYLGRSPSSNITDSPSPNGADSERRSKRRTLMDKAAGAVYGVAQRSRNSRWLGPPSRGILRFAGDDTDASRVIREMRERERTEMERYRNGIDAKNRMGGDGKLKSKHDPLDRPRDVSYVVTSPGWVGRREWQAGREGAGESKKGRKRKWWFFRSETDDKAKTNQKIWRYSIILAILGLSALTIGLCVSLLTKSNSTSSTSPSGSPDSASASTSSSTTSAPAPTTTSSQSLTACLQSFQSSAPTSPLSFPCSDCVPLMTSTTNDFDTPLVNGNSTGVGAALQFCALMDVFKGSSGNGSVLGDGWGSNASPCGWNGIGCDSRGRVTEITLKYPAVPDVLPDSLGNIVALQALHLMGNSSIPTGSFPSSLLSLPEFTTLDLEYTALTGPLPSTAFASAPGLITLVLANNKALGTSLPSLESNKDLLTLAVTGQGLVNAAVSTLPSSLTYLDLSYNALAGTIPSFSQLTSLKTLYLQSNSFTSPPTTLPSALTTISLTSNTGLEGVMPASVCSSSVLTSCDLRQTGLSGLGSVGNATTASTTKSVSNATSSSTSSSAVVSSTTKSCGVCLLS